jgi:plastocyanin
VLVCAVALVLAAPAAAEIKTETFRSGPITVAPYEVKQSDFTLNIPKPRVDGAITRMSIDLSDVRTGRKVPINRLMLHHIVFSNIGRQFGERRDATCQNFTLLDSKSRVPGPERFNAAGEERFEMRLPQGYGYPFKADDQWGMTWMVMNHRAVVDRAYVEYTVTYDTDPSITPAKMLWMDVNNCKADPIYDVPGGGAPGSTHTRTMTYTVPEAGRIIAAGGHVHGGGKQLRLSQPECGDRTLVTSKPAWGTRSHPFYNVKPILHEPGPINMSGTLSQKGFPVAKGQVLKLTSEYDAELPHTRVMGIMGVYFVPDATVTERCAPLPDDVTTYATSAPHRTTPPRFTVPLTGLDARGRAVTISRPDGATRRAGSSATVRVGDNFFSQPNLSVARGARVRWDFRSRLLHNVTLASGPRGFSSVHLDGGRSYTKRLTVPGNYKLFCALHPVSMTQAIEVR